MKEAKLSFKEAEDLKKSPEKLKDKGIEATMSIRSKIARNVFYVNECTARAKDGV